ncbi:EAL domain-containing protein [Treponema sp. OttesenSCG-928-L16]|nr:EAL domain-containing protein [Treponema sp. OttesenSCG-928-L16]
MDKKEEDYSITDFINIDYLHSIQESMAKIAKVATLIVDSEGRRITKSFNYCDYCAKLNDLSGTAEQCIELYKELSRINRETREPVVRTCPVSGLTLASVPIFMEELYLGSWLIGQVCTHDTDISAVRQVALDAGYSQEEADKYIAGLTVLSKEEFNTIFSFLKSSTDELIHLIKANNDIRQKNEELLLLTDRINASSNTFRTLVDMADVGLYVTDYYTGEILLSNNVFSNSHGMTSKEVIGKKCFSLLNYEEPCPFCPAGKLLNEQGEPGEPAVWENYLPKLDKWFRFTNRAFYWVDGRLAHMCTYIDITEQKNLEEEISYIAYYDQRLNLPNAMRLVQDSKQINMDRAYLICFDIKDLRQINEVYSRETGDKILENIVIWLSGFPNLNSLFYRIDGDSFALLMLDSMESDVMAFAETIAGRFRYPWHIEFGDAAFNIFIRISIGVFFCGAAFDDYADFINRFERILDLARTKRGVLMYSDELKDSLHEHLRLELSLKDCVLNNMQGFSLAYQPLADPCSGTWSGMEVLCRWNMPEHGPVSPDVFIREAEQSGLISSIGEWTLRESIIQVKKWGLDRLGKFMLDVNLSPLQLNDHSHCENLIRIMKENDYPPEKLSLEITESAEVQFNEYTLASLNLFRKAGIILALDDFGTGYASFSNLRNLPISIVKVDRSFVTNIENDYYLQQMMYIITEFVHGAELKVVVEGVENQEQVQILLRNKVDYFQGYLFSKPLDAETLESQIGHFMSSEGVFPVYTLNPINIKDLEKPEGSYIPTPNLIKLQNYCLYYFINELDIRKALNAVLEKIGESLDASRAYVFVLKKDGRARNIAEWCRPGTEPSLYRIEDVEFSPHWVEVLTKNGIIQTSDMIYFSEELKKDIHFIKVNSIVALPIWKLGEFKGFIGVDVLEPRHRDWFPEEIQALYYLASFVSWALREDDLYYEYLELLEEKQKAKV